MLNLNINNRCNQRCVYCNTQKMLLDNTIQETSEKEIMQQIQEASKKSDDVCFTGGGMVSMLDNLPKLIKYCRDKGVQKIGMETNGIKISDRKYLKELIMNGLAYCTISLHSHIERISDEITQTPDSFKKTIKGLENLKKENIPTSIFHTINSLNYRYLIDFVKFLENEFPKIRRVTFSFIRPIYGDIESEKITPKLSMIEPYLHKVFSYCQERVIDFGIGTGCSIPYCYLGEYFTYSDELSVYYQLGKVAFNEISYSNEKVKDSKCQLCSLNEMCSGISKSYAKQYGTDELYPLFTKPKNGEYPNKYIPHN